MNAPNDLVVARDGTVYFTDPDLATWVGKRRLGFNGVYRIAPKSREITLMSDVLREPNGVALSRNETILYVSDEMKGNVVAFHLDANGQARDHRKFAGRLPGADGMTVDAQDNLYVATKRGIVVLTPSGRRIATLTIEDPETHKPVRPTNCTFGGPDGNTLFVTAERAVYRLEPRSVALANPVRTTP